MRCFHVLHVSLRAWRSLSVMVAALFGAATLLGASAIAQAAPTINNVSTRGLTIGAASTLVLDGAEFDPNLKIVSTLPIAEQKVQLEGSNNRAKIELKVADQAAPGIYSLRVANAGGVSNAVLIAVDRLPNQPLAPQTTVLPVALQGSLTGEARVRTTVAAKKGQLFLAEVECQRLASSFRPVLRLFDARGVQVAWAAPSSALGRDSRLLASIPADGEYAVEVHDVLFRAPGPGYFRLKLGEFRFADAAFPSGATIGQLTSAELRRSNAPPGTRFDFDARMTTLPGDYPATWSAANAMGPLTGIPPRMTLSEFAQYAEPSEPPTAPRVTPPAPLTIHGWLGARGEEDRFSVPVAPGAKLQFEVQAAQLGSPLDGVLSVLGPAGNGLASNDDRPGTSDPAVDVTVPADANQVIVVVRDLEGRGGADFTYRVVVRDLNRPNFSLTLDSDRLTIPAGGSRLVTLPITRQGDTGAIQLELPGLPAGVQVAGASIAPHHGVGIVSLSAPAGTAPAASIAHLVGKSANGQPPVVRAAQVAEAAGHRLQPWLQREWAVAISAADPLALTWVPGAPDEKLTLGGKLPVKVQLTRAANATGVVRVRLVTSQATIKKTVKVNNKDEQVDDLDRMLRLEAEFQIPAGAMEGTSTLLVPADLPVGDWNLALVAEQLAADGKTVVTSASSQVRTLAAAKSGG